MTGVCDHHLSIGATGRLVALQYGAGLAQHRLRRKHRGARPVGNPSGGPQRPGQDAAVSETARSSLPRTHSTGGFVSIAYRLSIAPAYLGEAAFAIPQRPGAT